MALEILAELNGEAEESVFFQALKEKGSYLNEYYRVKKDLLKEGLIRYRLNEEYEITKKKKEALDNLFENGRISQSTRDSFDTDINAVIMEIEKQQKDLLMKMQGKAEELESQVKTLETLLANYEIQHVVGEIDEDMYQREITLLSTGLESAKRELDIITEATSQLCPPVEETAVEPSLPAEETEAAVVQDEPVENVPCVPEEVEVAAEEVAVEPCPCPEDAVVTMDDVVPEQPEIAQPEIECESTLSEESPQVTEEAPQEMEYQPQVAEEMSEDMTETLEVTEESVEITEEMPQNTEYTPEDVAEEQPQATEEIPQSNDEKFDVPAEQPEYVEDLSQNMEETVEQPEMITEFPQIIENEPQLIEETIPTAEETPVEAHPSEAPKEAPQEITVEATAEEEQSTEEAAEAETADSDEDTEYEEL